MLKRIFTGLYHFSWYAFAFIVLNAAVLATVVRLALPEIGSYKNEIQSWVSEYMDYPVVIDEISAEWQGWVPHLYLKGIDLYTPDNKVLISKFDSAHLGIDLIASLNQREIVPSHLSISGLNLEFTRNIDGSISINNDNNNLSSNANNNAALSDWLLKQKHIVIENADLIWHDKKSSKDPQHFSNVKIELKTQKQRVQIEATISLPEQYGQSLTIKMDVMGNILTPDWNGAVYVEAKEINPTSLLDNLPIKSIGGNANIKLWTNWNKAKLIDVSGEIHYSDFSLNAGQYNLPIHNINLILHGERKQDKDWLLNITVANLETSHGLWPSSNYQIKLEKNDSGNNYQYSGYLSYLKLEETLPFIVASNIIPKKLLEKLHWQSISGELTNINFGFDPEFKTESNIWFDTLFKNLDLVSNDKNNAIYGLEGQLTSSGNLTKITLNSKNSKINLGSIFDTPYMLSTINAKLELVNNDSIELLIKKLNIEDQHISIASSGKIRFDKDSPFIDLVVHVDETSIENVPVYLPKQTAPGFKNWLTHALIGGQILSADLIYHGHSADFPFKNSEGNFKAIFNIDDASFDYNEGWPPLDKLTAEVIIDNDDLSVFYHSGYIFDATIDGLTINVKNMSGDNHHVLVNGTINGHTSDMKNFILQSPLNESPSLNELTDNIAGSISLKLGLDIPLDDAKTSIDGILSFTDTTIGSDLPGLELENVNGSVHFTRDQIWAENIDALYYGKPVKLNIPKTYFDDPKESEELIISGFANKEFIVNQLTSFFPSLHDVSENISTYFSGESKWSVSIKNATTDGETKNKNVTLSSDLKGITINLPSPLGKIAEEIRPISLTTRLSNLLINEININYDHTIFADIIVDNTQDFIVKHILVGLGQQHPQTLTSSHISVQGELEELDIPEWIGFINPGKTSPPQKNNINKKIITGDIYIQKLKMIGNEFNNINISFSNPDKGWEAFFDSENLIGHAQFVKEENNRLFANLEKLSLKKSDDDQDGLVINKIPELDINIDNFIFAESKLGQLTLQTSNIDNGININNLSLIKPGFSIKATGEWMRVDGVNRSDFHAVLETDSIATMLKTFNFSSANINEGQTTIEMNANWMDTPMNFSMEKIDGTLEMKIGKGQFLDIDPSAGRLFGLLSLQTLPRRLTLDFSDLFDEGFSFDSIKGNFSLQQGHAYTNDLQMTGPSANIAVSGRTGFVTEDYDQIATITPKVSNSLPLASALFGPIGVGVGAVIYLTGELFKSIPEKIDQILRYQYSIKGSWDNPDIVKIKKDS